MLTNHVLYSPKIKQSDAVQGTATPEAESEASLSALRENIERKGRNAYYYAHSHKADGPAWDGKEEPRLLERRESQGAAAAAEKPEVAATAVTQYSWADEDEAVKIYVELANVGELAKDSIQLEYTRTSFSLLILGYNGGNLKLSFAKTFEEMENVTFVQKPNRIIVKLHKAQEKKWPCINAGTPSK